MQDLTLKEAETIALSILKQVMEEKVKTFILHSKMGDLCVFMHAILLYPFPLKVQSIELFSCIVYTYFIIINWFMLMISGDSQQCRHCQGGTCIPFIHPC